LPPVNLGVRLFEGAAFRDEEPMRSYINKFLAPLGLASWLWHQWLEGNAFQEPTAPDAKTGHVIAHTVKGILVYVTSTEDVLIKLTFTISALVFAAVLVSSVLKMAPKK
jgi:hypothetical protein